MGRKKERYDLDLIFRAANVCSVASSPLTHLTRYPLWTHNPFPVVPFLLGSESMETEPGGVGLNFETLT